MTILLVLPCGCWKMAAIYDAKKYKSEAMEILEECYKNGVAPVFVEDDEFRRSDRFRHTSCNVCNSNQTKVPQDNQLQLM